MRHRGLTRWTIGKVVCFWCCFHAPVKKGTTGSTNSRLPAAPCSTDAAYQAVRCKKTGTGASEIDDGQKALLSTVVSFNYFTSSVRHPHSLIEHILGLRAFSLNDTLGRDTHGPGEVNAPSGSEPTPTLFDADKEQFALSALTFHVASVRRLATRCGAETICICRRL